jgi:hypothetical protein
MTRQRQKIKTGCFAIQISGLKITTDLDEILQNFPGAEASEPQLCIRHNDKLILLKKEKEMIRDKLMGQDIEVEGNFFIFNCSNASPNESISF